MISQNYAVNQYLVSNLLSMVQTKEIAIPEIQRPFVFVTKDGEELSEQAQAFMDFATSSAASELIANAGAVPLK